MARHCVVIGESVVDRVYAPDGTEIGHHPGGSPANVAVGLARLGVPPTFVTQFGDDPDGRIIGDHLRAEAVHVERPGGTDVPTSIASAYLDESGSAQYEFDLQWQLTDLQVSDTVTLLHVGSLGLVVQPGADAVERLVQQTAAQGDVLISYDPNLRPSLDPDPAVAAERFLRLCRYADVVKLSLDDLHFMFEGMAPETLAEMLITGYHCPRLLVVTCGADGVFYATASQRRYLDSIRVDVRDTVGAGDAFMAGLLAGILTSASGRPRDVLRSLDWSAPMLELVVRSAVATAALTCMRSGAEPPTRAEVDELLEATGPRAAG